jgi:hypothetical protein
VNGAVVHAEPLGGRRPEPHHDDVRLLEEPEEDLEPLVALEIEAQRPRVAPHAVGPDGRLPLAPAALLDHGARFDDANHVRPEVREDPGAVGSRADIGEIYDPDAVQCAAHSLAFAVERLAFALLVGRGTPL